MSKTPKANVRRRYPKAYAQRIEQWWHIREDENAPAGLFSPALGSGRSAMHAWKSAAKAIAVPREK